MLTHVTVSLGKGFCDCCQLRVLLLPLTRDSGPILVTSNKGLKGFNTPGSYSRSPWDVAQGLTAAPGALVCPQLQGSTGCQACLAAARQQLAGQSVFVQPWALVCSLAVDVVSRAVHGKLQ